MLGRSAREYVTMAFLTAGAVCRTEHTDSERLSRGALGSDVVENCQGRDALRIGGMELSVDFTDEPSLSPDAVNVVLYDDMPLISPEIVIRYARVMLSRGLGHLRLGEGAYICRGSASDEGVFVKDEAFLRLGDAKSYNMVYNCLKERIIERHLAAGVYILDSSTVFIDDTVVIEPGARILPFCRFEGTTRVETEAVASATFARDSVIEREATVEYSYLTDSCVHSFATVGPFARLRGAEIGERCRIGDFVEIKASKLFEGVKAAHLAYIGDAEVGDSTNVGCGAVFCNYDGKLKHPTKVGSRCFIGANTNLVAPVTVGDGAYIAAGTTVTQDIPKSHFAIGRSRQEIKDPRPARKE